MKKKKSMALSALFTFIIIYTDESKKAERRAGERKREGI